MVSDVLDEWLSTQRKWLYLEVIFGQVEIQVDFENLQNLKSQRQLFNETAKFMQVDRMWKDFMDKTRKKPFILELCTSQITLNLFTDSNRLLISIQVS